MCPHSGQPQRPARQQPFLPVAGLLQPDPEHNKALVSSAGLGSVACGSTESKRKSGLERSTASSHPVQCVGICPRLRCAAMHVLSTTAWASDPCSRARARSTCRSSFPRQNFRVRGAAVSEDSDRQSSPPSALLLLSGIIHPMACARGSLTNLDQ